MDYKIMDIAWYTLAGGFILALLILITIKNLLDMSKVKEAIQALRNEVNELKTVQGAAKALIQGLKTRVDEAVAALKDKGISDEDLAELNALSAELDSNTGELAEAVAANTEVPATELTPAPVVGETDEATEQDREDDAVEGTK